jgi:hypothetical protein
METEVMPLDRVRGSVGAVPTRPDDILGLMNDQVQLLAAIAAGRSRDPDLDREYWVRGRTLRMALGALGLPDPFPFRDLSAWVAECRLRHPDPLSSRERLNELTSPVRALLEEAAA